eukprot:CAMPEP_0197030500 /NCGR_PEP_ID=MMETSP1384-20130603/9728_1 /TAXON_ID=29189 /ORGANISM="Ammonia sp." /LENGTH=623 /DNA_ID=CAMNT_0042459871 /DNA_START=16 /DNA_END=1887 /DNA_ORIENTATION=+
MALFWLFSLFWCIVRSDIYSCPRVHKAWHLTTEDERQMYITAVHRLNEQGKLKLFGLTHQNFIDQIQAHNTAEFFAWHRYLLWEFENQIRRLGEEYECFALPYWDVSTDAGLFQDAFAFNSGLGGVGELDHDECVNIENDGAWSRAAFPLEHVCHTDLSPQDNVDNGCCLKRAAARGADVSGVSEYTRFIKSEVNYGANNGFRFWTFLDIHGEVHVFVGGGWDSYTHMISRFASEDPLFYLLHSWLDYLFVVWKQCWGYDQIAVDELDEHPAAYFSWPKNVDGIPGSELDDKLYYVPMEKMDWWEGDERNPTARSMYDEHDWLIQYERGTFLARSHLTALCTNDAWDESVLLQNSEETNAIIESLRGSNGESEVDRYQHRTWDYMDKLWKDETFGHDFQEADYLQTWSAKTCNFQRQRLGKEPCYVPQEYEKCTQDDYERREEISLDELLQKEGVKGNECLEEVRTNMYGYAKMVNLVYELCTGQFDKYHVCEAPMIDFMIDSDDEVYYEALIANKQRMKMEMQQMQKVAMDADGEGQVKKDRGTVLQELDRKSQGLPVMGAIGNYPKFAPVSYMLIAFVVGGLAFITIVARCCSRYHAKKGTDRGVSATRNSFTYGSVVEML